MIELAELAALLIVLSLGAWLLERPTSEQRAARRRNQARRVR